MMSHAKNIDIKIDYMQQRHMDDVENIENDLFEHPWSREELESARRKRYYLSRVAVVTPKDTNQKIVAGAMFVEQDKSQFTILSIAVHNNWLRHGIGSAFLKHIIDKLKQDGRSRIYELVRETNLTAQKFYRTNGFVAQRPKLNAFDTDEDAFPMVYRWEWSPQGIVANGKPNMCSRRKHLCTECGECS